LEFNRKGAGIVLKSQVMRNGELDFPPTLAQKIPSAIKPIIQVKILTMMASEYTPKAATNRKQSLHQ
jgi:hypothetical protein